MTSRLLVTAGRPVAARCIITPFKPAITFFKTIAFLKAIAPRPIIAPIITSIGRITQWPIISSFRCVTLWTTIGVCPLSKWP